MILAIAVLFGMCGFLIFWYFGDMLIEKKMVARRLKSVQEDSGPVHVKEDILRKMEFSKQDQRTRAGSGAKGRRLIILLLLVINGAIFLLRGSQIPALKFALIFIAGVVLFLFLGRQYLKRARRERIDRELPGTLDLMVVCLEAGLGINSALLRVANEMQDSPLGQELRRISDEVNAGIPLEDAFRNFAKRIQAEDVNTITTAIIQSQRMGTALALTFRIQAETLREKYKMKVKEKINRVPIKILFPLVFFIFPALFVIILGPSVLFIMKELGGKT